MFFKSFCYLFGYLTQPIFFVVSHFKGILSKFDNNNHFFLGLDSGLIDTM